MLGPLRVFTFGNIRANTQTIKLNRAGGKQFFAFPVGQGAVKSAGWWPHGAARETKRKEKLMDASPESLAEALRLVLEAHRQWVESNGVHGKRLDLSGQDLTLVDCHDTKFHAGNFEGAHFDQANMKKTTHPGVDWHGAEISDMNGAKFSNRERRERHDKDWRTLDRRESGGIGRITK
jgi:hypothetical protein